MISECSMERIAIESNWMFDYMHDNDEVEDDVTNN
jgi:hypothetical protein